MVWWTWVNFGNVRTQGGLFAEYFNTFLKLKQESSGYTSCVQNEEDKDNYNEGYRSAERIALDKSSISKNVG